MEFQIYRAPTGLLRWRLVTQDGAVLAESGRSYWDLGGCKTAIAQVQEHAARAAIRAPDEPAAT
jgi:uncharacterized protein YegP (UPF0339 family)